MSIQSALNGVLMGAFGLSHALNRYEMNQEKKREAEAKKQEAEAKKQKAEEKKGNKQEKAQVKNDEPVSPSQEIYWDTLDSVAQKIYSQDDMIYGLSERMRYLEERDMETSSPEYMINSLKESGILSGTQARRASYNAAQRKEVKKNEPPENV